MSDASLPVLELRGVRKSFDHVDVLKGIDLSVAEHEVVVVIGASGSGKSTLLRVTNLIERVSDGQVLLAGEDITDPRVNVDAVRSRIGVVFQHYNLFPHMNVMDNVTLAARKVHKWSRTDAEAKAAEMLTRIGLAAKMTDFPDRLSGGQQQRVAIIRALLTDPQLLLLDEITSALDPQLVGEVLDLVRELKTSGSTILMATHEMSFAREAANRVVFMHDGLILEQGEPEAFFSDPQQEQTREFLARVNRR